MKKELGLDEEAIILLYVGRINKIKGIDILIEAFKNVSQKIFRLVLVLVGELFPEEISVETLKQERIILLPPSLDIRKYYNLSNMVVLPSRREPLGLAMLEAGAMCKPFIGSNTGGISEFIENGVNGILVEHENPNDLAEAIERAIRDKELSENIAHNLKVKVRDECNARNYMEKLISIYKELLWEN
ncbi:MAG: glycosyltransferase family 4 protein [Ignavibacteria bacterium]